MSLFFRLLVALCLVVNSLSYADLQLPPRPTPIHPEPDATTMKIVENYISWGSASGKYMPDCAQFQSIFGLNRTWASPFTASQFYAYDIQKACQQLAQNLSWHAASLEAGHYLYPFYNSAYGQTFWKVAFVWTAVGGANGWSEVLKLKEYDFKIITTLWFQVYPNNVSYIFMASDLFYPAAESFPTTLKEMVDNYISFLGGNCKTWATTLYLDYGMLTVSGDETEYFGPTQLTEYCSKMVYMWSSYVHNVHYMTYSVDGYTGKVNNVAFTWTRTGLYQGSVRTDEVLTVFDVYTDKTPTEDLRIGTAADYFQPPM